MRGHVLGLVVAVVLGAGAARAQEAPPPLLVAPPPAAAPSSSTPWLASGGVLLGLGVGTLATAPICYVSPVRVEHHVPCLATSLAVGAALSAVGIPLLVVGARRRAELPRVALVPLPGGAVLAWSASW